MRDVTVITNEPNVPFGGNHNVTVDNKKLYLPNTADIDGYGSHIIYVGADNNIEIDVRLLTGENGVGTDLFWLRSPISNSSEGALVAAPSFHVNSSKVIFPFVSVVPAFNLNLSSAIFASAADAASSSWNGDKPNNDMTANTYTMRYNSAGDETAEISVDGTKVTVENANGKYLMVQNAQGVNAKLIESAGKMDVNASAITIGGTALTSFSGCKVWLESTDEGRITTAKLATQATITDIPEVAITDITEPTVGSALDTQGACATTGVANITPIVAWTPSDATAGYNTTYMASVTLSADTNYQFTDAVTATVNGNAANVTKNPDGTLTVTYAFATPKDKLISITMPDPITVANGTAYANMGLPTTVGIVTEGSTVTTADVSWDTTKPASGSYDPSILTEQMVTLNGTVTCPDSIDQNEVALSTSITITISPAGTVGTPTFDPVGTTYTENQSVTLSSTTEGATIYYTTDGTDPTTDSSVYTTAISVTGTAGESNQTTIKAMAVKDGMITSSISSATYTIEIPITTYNIIVQNDGNGSAASSVSKAAPGTKVTLSAKAKDGYQFKEWQVVSGTITIKDNAFTMPEGNVTVKAIFEKKTTPTPTPTPTAKPTDTKATPATGDNSDLSLWLAMVFVSSGAIIGGLFIRKRRKITK